MMARLNDGGGAGGLSQAEIDAAKKAAITATAPKDPLAELQASIASSKKQVQAKNIEIPTIALEQATNAGDITAIQQAATDLGKAQGLTGSALRTFAYNTAQTAAKGEKPTPPPADEYYVYDYVWRQDVGGPGGKWVLVQSPNPAGPTWAFDSNGMLFYKGKPFTGTYQGKNYVDGKGPGYKETGSGNKGPTGTTDSTASTTYTAPDGRIFTDLNAYNAYLDKLKTDQKKMAGESAFTVFRSYLDQFGLGALAADVEKYKIEGLSDQELLMKLRTESKAYKDRFAANELRVKAGLKALTEAEYILKEDAYQQKMREYGLPESYYARGDLGRQQGFEKLIAGDVSAVELEDRIQTAQDRLLNAAPEIMGQLKGYYNISQGDILAYILDPQNALPEIKRKVQAAEIGAAALQSGLGVDKLRAEQLRQYNVTGAAYRQAAPIIKQAAERGSQLASFFKQQPYTQQTAESMALKVGDVASALEQTTQLGALESAQFRGQAGMAGGALERNRAGAF